MRPIYETDEDRSREGEVAAYIEQKYNCKFVRSEKLTVVDGVLLHPNGNAAALVEIKVRNNESARYPTYMLSATKWRNGLAEATNQGVVFLLVVRFTDGVFVTKLKQKYQVGEGGRRDRNDPKDIEQCIFIPMSDFRKL